MALAKAKAKRVPEAGYALSGNAFKKGGKVNKGKPSWNKKKHRGRITGVSAESPALMQY